MSLEVSETEIAFAVLFGGFGAAILKQLPDCGQWNDMKKRVLVGEKVLGIKGKSESPNN
jgi:hypothetical protein